MRSVKKSKHCFKLPYSVGGAKNRRKEPGPVLQPGGGGYRAEAAGARPSVPGHSPAA
jgi:hypothetical protein